MLRLGRGGSDSAGIFSVAYSVRVRALSAEVVFNLVLIYQNSV